VRPEESPELSLADARGKIRTSLGSLADGTPMLRGMDAQREPRAVLTLHDSAPISSLMDGHRHPRVLLDVASTALRACPLRIRTPKGDSGPTSQYLPTAAQA